MRQADVQIGATYRTKVGSELVVVMVTRTAGRRGGSRQQFECLNSVTQRRIYRTAAKLRPMVDADKPAPAKRELVAYPDPELVRHPGLNPMSCICAQPNEVVKSVRSGDILELDDAHTKLVRSIVDRIHVAETFRTVAAAIRRKITRQYRYLSVPRALRRGLLYAAAKRHAANRNTYRMVMGDHPFPSEEMIGRAILGSAADRERLLRHVDELRAG